MTVSSSRKASPRGGRDIILITGATRGLGKATAKALVEKGYKVIVSGRSEEGLRSVVEELRGLGGGMNIDWVVMDVSSDESVGRARREVMDKYDSLDCLINNAGIMLKQEGGLEDLSLDDVLKTFNTNALGALRTLQVFKPLLIKSRNARVINVSSGMGAMEGMGSGSVGYRLSKTALNVLTIQAHYAFRSDGIRVIAVCPGWVRTDMGGEYAVRDLEEGISGILWGVETSVGGESGGFYRDGRLISW